MIDSVISLFFKNLNHFSYIFDRDKEIKLISSILDIMEEIMMLGNFNNVSNCQEYIDDLYRFIEPMD